MADPQTLAAYATRVSEYEGMGLPERQLKAIETFLEGVPEGGTIFDLGCGPGIQAAQMASAGYRVSALDASPEFVAAARGRGVDARLGTFEDLTEHAAYDALFASFSLLHAPRADLPRYLAAIHRALKPGGRFFLGLKLGQGEGRDALGRFYAYHSEEELRAHLAAAGFRITHAETGEGEGLAGSVDPYILIFADA